jgi:hypothetical protein
MVVLRDRSVGVTGYPVTALAYEVRISNAIARNSGAQLPADGLSTDLDDRALGIVVAGGDIAHEPTACEAPRDLTGVRAPTRRELLTDGDDRHAASTVW